MSGASIIDEQIDRTETGINRANALVNRFVARDVEGAQFYPRELVGELPQRFRGLQMTSSCNHLPACRRERSRRRQANSAARTCDHRYWRHISFLALYIRFGSTTDSATHRGLCQRIGRRREDEWITPKPG